MLSSSSCTNIDLVAAAGGGLLMRRPCTCSDTHAARSTSTSSSSSSPLLPFSSFAIIPADVLEHCLLPFLDLSILLSLRGVDRQWYGRVSMCRRVWWEAYPRHLMAVQRARDRKEGDAHPQSAAAEDGESSDDDPLGGPSRAATVSSSSPPSSSSSSSPSPQCIAVLTSLYPYLGALIEGAEREMEEAEGAGTRVDEAEVCGGCDGVVSSSSEATSHPHRFEAFDLDLTEWPLFYTNLNALHSSSPPPQMSAAASAASYKHRLLLSPLTLYIFSVGRIDYGACVAAERMMQRRGGRRGGGARQRREWGAAIMNRMSGGDSASAPSLVAPLTPPIPRPLRIADVSSDVRRDARDYAAWERLAFLHSGRSNTSTIRMQTNAAVSGRREVSGALAPAQGVGRAGDGGWWGRMRPSSSAAIVGALFDWATARLWSMWSYTARRFHTCTYRTLVLSLQPGAGVSSFFYSPLNASAAVAAAAASFDGMMNTASGDAQHHQQYAHHGGEELPRSSGALTRRIHPDAAPHKAIDLLAMSASSHRVMPLLRHYFEGTAHVNALVVVVDASRAAVLSDLAVFLKPLLDASELTPRADTVPILVMANKQDLPTAASPAEIAYGLREILEWGEEEKEEVNEADGSSSGGGQPCLCGPTLLPRVRCPEESCVVSFGSLLSLSASDAATRSASSTADDSHHTDCDGGDDDVRRYPPSSRMHSSSACTARRDQLLDTLQAYHSALTASPSTSPSPSSSSLRLSGARCAHRWCIMGTTNRDGGDSYRRAMDWLARALCL